MSYALGPWKHSRCCHKGFLEVGPKLNVESGSCSADLSQALAKSGTAASLSVPAWSAQLTETAWTNTWACYCGYGAGRHSLGMFVCLSGTAVPAGPTGLIGPGSGGLRLRSVNNTSPRNLRMKPLYIHL